MNRSVLLLSACLLGAGLGSARAQPDTREGIALQNQILELRRQVQDLQAQRGQGSSGGSARPAASAGASNDLTAQLLDRVQVLEDEVRRLRGQVDELSNASQRRYDELNKQIGDLAFKLEPQGAGAGPAAPPPRLTSPPPGYLGQPTVQPPASSPQPFQPPGLQASAPPSTAPARRTPEIAMQEANAALARHDYAAAEAAAREVLQNNRTSPRAYDAQFVVAQALAGKRDNPQAAIAFDDAYNRAKTGAHAQDALLGLADSLGAINERKAACETLNKLATEFPRPRPDVRASADASRQRNGCR